MVGMVSDQVAFGFNDFQDPTFAISIGEERLWERV